MDANQRLLQQAYHAFNHRDIDGALALMHTDVDWPNGMEGGFVHGHDAVRAYWTRQWNLIDPHVEPVAFTMENDGRIRAEVCQLIKDLTGTVIFTGTVYHLYQIKNGLVRRMDIEPVGEPV